MSVKFIYIKINIILLLIFSACSENRQNDISIDKNITDSINFRRYFEDSLAYDSGCEEQVNYEYIDDWQSINNKWLKKSLEFYLYAFEETPLFSSKGNNIEIYRFLMIRSFDPPICISIKRDDNNNILIGKITDGRGFSYPGLVKQEIYKELPDSSWNKFISLIDSLDFWEMNKNFERPLFDGSYWFVEGFRNKKYHYVLRRSPISCDNKQNQKLGKLGIFLTGLFCLEKGEVY